MPTAGLATSARPASRGPDCVCARHRWWLALALGLLANALQADPPRQALRFGNVAFDPLLEARSLPTPAPLDAHGRGLRLAQLHGPIRQTHLDELEAAGLQLLQYYPDNAYLVWADETALGRAAQLPSVRWLGDFAPPWKLADSLSGRAGRLDQVIVHYLDAGQPEAVRGALLVLGAELLQDYAAQPDGRFREAVVRVDASRLASISELPQVLWLGYQQPVAIRDDEMSAQIVAGNLDTNGVPEPGYLPFLGTLGLDGSGVRWSIIDDGVDLEHPDFAGRVSGGYDYAGCAIGAGPGSDGPTGGHGTHVAGIALGSGAGAFGDANGFAYGLGQAPGAQLYSQNPLCGPGANWPPTGGWSVLSEHALAGGALGANASWTTSEGVRHGYQASERMFDQMVRDGDFSTVEQAEAFAMVFSAGNSGPNPATLTSPKEAKNIISVGATQNYRSGPVNQLSDFSSRGPAVDGRTLPTLVAPGTSIASSRRRAGGVYCNAPIPGTGDLYAYCLGTSMAAPHVSGLAVLLVQWWQQQHAGAVPSPAMLKALLVDGARPLNAQSSLPDNQQGWGLAGLPPMLGDTALSWRAVDQSAVFDEPGEVHRYALRSVDPHSPLQITLAWTDAPGALGASPALVNDLDLELQSDSQLYLGNAPTSSGPGLAASRDRLNNLEGLRLSDPPQTALLRVSAHALPGDGVPLHGDQTDQDYALLCSNCEWVDSFDLIEVDRPEAICAPAQADFELELVPIGNFSQVVTLSLGSLPEGLQGNVNPSELALLPATVQVSVDSAGSTANGALTVPLQLQAGNEQRDFPLSFELSQSNPGTTELLRPEEASTNVPLRPELHWQGSADARHYRLQIDDDPDFSSPLLEQTLDATSFRPQQALPPNSELHWRVIASNACGEEVAPPARRFLTGPGPGNCAVGQRAVPLLRDRIIPGDSNWSHQAVLGADLWQVSDVRSHSPDHSYHGQGNFGRSDQRLLSPFWRLPPGEAAHLRFQHWYDIERRDALNCWDGLSLHLANPSGVLQDLQPTQFVQGGPTLTASGGNPIAGATVWCGMQDFAPVIVDLSPQAGSSGRLAFRLTSDTHVSREGWYVDDVEIYTCVDDDLLFRNGLGAEAW